MNVMALGVLSNLRNCLAASHKNFNISPDLHSLSGRLGPDKPLWDSGINFFMYVPIPGLLEIKSRDFLGFGPKLLAFSYFPMTFISLIGRGDLPFFEPPLLS